MKNQLISTIVLALLILSSCKQPTPDEVAEAPETKAATELPDYADFDKKVEIIRTFMKAHGDENIDLQAEMMADTLEYSPPYYNGNKWLGKEDYIAALKGYHADFDDIKFTEGIPLGDTLAGGMWSGSVYPEASASTSADAIRIYGTWTAKHTETGKSIGVKWFGLAWINKDGKFTRLTDYFDVHGLAAQIAEE